MEHHNNFIIKYNLATPIAIIIAGALIAASISFGGKSVGNSTTVDAVAPDQKAPSVGAKIVDVAKVKTSGEPYIGKANAPVTMAFWSDYQCPFCKKFDTSVISQLESDYVAKGKLRIIFKDFAFLGADSDTAALAERAVWEVNPAKFYEWHKAMFTKQDAENGGWGDKDDILALTNTILGSYESDKVATLMVQKQAQYQKAIDAAKAEGGNFGVNGTPASIVGKTFINGAQSYSTVKAAIDQALADK